VLLSKTRVSVLLVVMVVVLVLSVELWGAVGSASTKDKDTHSATEDVQALTPIVGEVSKAPIPFEGSDGRTHLVYELEVTNFSNGKTTIQRLKVLDADTNEAVATLNAKEVAARLQPAGFREPVDTLAPSTTALVFLHVSFGKANQVPDRLIHRLSVKAEAAPPGQQKISEKLAPTKVYRRDVKVVGPR
jgi:hypothetical protein